MTETNDGQVTNSQFVEDVIPSDGEISYDTEDLDADDYFVAGDGQLNRTPMLDDTFEVRTQSLSTEFDDDEVTDEGSNALTDFDISSNRGSYTLNVSADGDLDDEELYDIFNDGARDYNTAKNTDDYTVDADGNPTGGDYSGNFKVGLYDSGEEDADEKILLYNIDDREYETNFTDIDSDDYDFELNATETEASDTASISVTEQDSSAAFGQSVYTQTAGDIVEVTVELEDADESYVQFGSEDAGFVDIIRVEDDDDDDEVTFEINTRTLGAVGTDAEDAVYNSEDDIVESSVHGDADDDIEFQNEDGGDLPNDNDFEQYLYELDLIDDPDYDPNTTLTRPLQATDYDMAANGNNVFIVNDDEESELDDEIGLATVDLTPPGVQNIQTWSASGDNADEDDNLEDLLDSVSQREDIAIDDRLVIQAEASGIYGQMAYQASGDDDDSDFEALDDGFSGHALYQLNNVLGEGVTFEVEADDATGNQEPTSLNLEDMETNEVFVLVDNDAGEMYVVADTSNSDVFSSSLEDGTDFTAELEYEADEDNRYEFNGEEPYGGAGDTTADAFPYFQAGEDNTQSASTEFTLADREATFNNVNDNDEVEIEVAEDATISGTTNVAPGSDASIRVRSAQDVSPSFVETTDANITEDGEFSAEFDFSGQSVDDTATVNFRVAGSSISDSDAVLIEEVEEEDGEDGEDDGEDGEDTDGEDGEDTDGEDGEDTDGEDGEDTDGEDGSDDGSDGEDGGDGESEDGTPGFGALVALVALIAAALLATRRNE
ncbi:BGTF surface domain-containing protein [Halorubrum halophilum]